MDLAVDRVTCDHQSDGRYVQRAGAVGVGVAELDRPQLLPFDLEWPVGERLDDESLIGDLAWEPGLPEAVEPPRATLRRNVLGHVRRRDDPGVGKALQHRGSAEEVITVGVRDEDVGDVRAGGGDHSARARDSSMLISESTRIASRSPKMSVEVVGDQRRRSSPGGRSSETATLPPRRGPSNPALSCRFLRVCRGLFALTDLSLPKADEPGQVFAELRIKALHVHPGGGRNRIAAVRVPRRHVTR
jgi:hypothetical protein